MESHGRADVVKIRAHFGPVPSAGSTTGATIRGAKSDQPDTHFADVAFRKNAERGELLPIDHLWICNASLPSWRDVFTMRRASLYLLVHGSCARTWPVLVLLGRRMWVEFGALGFPVCRS